MSAEEILGKYFEVLDHGFIACLDVMGDDASVEQAARVSYGAGTRKKTQTRGLLRYLKRMEHSTPYEMVEFKFHVCCPIFVARQWIRHRTSSTNEYSGRYSLIPMLFYTPEADQFKAQSKDNNQGRGSILDNTEKYKAAVSYWNELRKSSKNLYEDLIEADVARELARIDLPLSVYTQFYWKVNLHNLMHFLTLRTDDHAQYEIRAYANIMAGMLKQVAPLSYEAWIDYDVGGTNFSRMEMNVIKELLYAYENTSGVGHIDLNQDTGISNLGDSKYGLSKREVNELVSKLGYISDPPNFELDLSQAKDPEYFEKRMAEAIPNVDK